MSHHDVAIIISNVYIAAGIGSESYTLPCLVLALMWFGLSFIKG